MANSLRHQFIANMKTIYSREELSAMADTPIDTQVEHSKRCSAWTYGITEIPMPVEDQVTQVRKRLELFDERQLLLVLKQAAERRRSDDSFDEDIDDF